LTRIRLAILLIGALLGLVLSGPALAKCKGTSKGNGSVSVYVEQIPSSCGSKPVGHGSGTVPLSQAAQSHLQASGTNGALLRRIATSRALGAPEKNLHRGRIAISAPGSAVSASFGALGGGSGARLTIILGIMAATAVVLLGGALYRRRSTR
jgi:hypothetical protein